MDELTNDKTQIDQAVKDLKEATSKENGSVLSDLTSLNLRSLPKRILNAPKAIYNDTIGNLVGSKEKRAELGLSIKTSLKTLGGNVLQIGKNVGSTLKLAGKTLKNIGASLFGKKRRNKGEASDLQKTSEESQVEMLEEAEKEVPDTALETGSKETIEGIKAEFIAGASVEELKEGETVDNIVTLGQIALPLIGTPQALVVKLESPKKTEYNTAKKNYQSNFVTEDHYYDKRISNYSSKYPSALGIVEKSNTPSYITIETETGKFTINNFLLESIQYSRNERTTVMPLLNGDNIIYFYGKNPTTIQVSCICFDTYNQEWLYDMEYYYENIIRGTKSTYGDISVSLNYDNKQVRGFITSFNSGKNSSSPNAAQIQFSMIVTEEIYNYENPLQRGAAYFNTKSAGNKAALNKQAISSILNRISDTIGERSVNYKVTSRDVSQ